MNNNNLLEQINERIKLMNSLSDRIENKIKQFPEGRIEIKHIGKRVYYYYIDPNSNTVLINNQSKLIGDLTQKSYLEKVIRASKKETSALMKLLDDYPETIAEDVYEQLNDDRKMLVKPITQTDAQFLNEWQNTPYIPKPFKEGTPVYMTLKGERVRSKSEQIIADRLFVNGIPYKYECPLKVLNKIIHPDFTILRLRDRKELYHEHLGKTDDDKYQNDNVPRINDYILDEF